MLEICRILPYLRSWGKINKPVLLKRGFTATIDEWLGTAEYILLGGNRNVILCKRGIRTFETHTRFTTSAYLLTKGMYLGSITSVTIGRPVSSLANLSIFNPSSPNP